MCHFHCKCFCSKHLNNSYYSSDILQSGYKKKNIECENKKNIRVRVTICVNTVNKVSDLNLRIELLSKKTIRDKLISYFRILSEKNFSKTFTLPFSLTDLADYLSVDRSAMMRELKSLKNEGFIKKSDKNKITLLS